MTADPTGRHGAPTQPTTCGQHTDSRRTQGRDAMTPYTLIDSPLGPLLAVGDGAALTGLYLPTGKHPVTPDPSWTRDDAALGDVAQQLEEYFGGRRQRFELPLAP